MTNVVDFSARLAAVSEAFDPIPPPSGKFEVDRVVPIPIPVRCAVTVYIDGKPYCGMESPLAAQQAILLWKRNWPAVQGKEITTQLRKDIH